MHSSSDERYMVTSALPYANGPIHVGHVAGVYLPADIYVRYLRMKRRDVVHVCGSDEHGVPIMLRARKEGVDPQEIVNRYHEMIADGFEKLGISFDHYGRTSSPIHHETSQAFFSAMAEKGSFRIEKHEQLFDPEAQLFLADRFVRGTCPKCDYDDAYGDQCEKCGQTLSPKELINPRSAITNAEPELRTTAHWYLPLDEIQPWLEEWIDSREGWKTNVLGQVKSWLQDGLAKRAMTRDLPWGVSVPADAAERAGVEPDGKVMYVWFDAPIGYISMTREWAALQGDPDLWIRYWKDEKTKLIHFLGKDNIVFHCIIFPAMLHLRGGYILPSQVPGNEFLNLRGMKFSTSRGVAVWLHEFLERYPADYLRYAVAKVIPESKDSEFAWEALQAAVNNELADTFGNFVNRSFTFAEKYFEARVPALENPSALDLETLAALREFPARIGHMMDAHRFREAVDETMALARLGNKYFNDSEPWRTRKTDLTQCRNTIHVSLQLSAALSVLFEPVIPFAAKRLQEMLRLSDVVSSEPAQGEGRFGWDEAGEPLLEVGHALGEAAILFSKFTDEDVSTEVEKLRLRVEGPVAPESSPEPTEPTEPTESTEPTEAADYTALESTIGFDDFCKVDLRIGRVTKVESVPKSKKLLRTEVDLGFETRQILAGVAQHMKPEDLLGRRVVVVANLAPRKIFGLESQGMLLMAEDREGNLVPVSAESEPGSVVR